MTFSTFAPLSLLILVPVIIIIYLLKPRGVKKVIPSLMLWKNAQINESSLTITRRLLRKLLMILEIIIMLLLIFALMSPHIRTGLGKTDVNTVIVLDASGSMQTAVNESEAFRAVSGKYRSRFDAALDEIIDYASSSDGALSVITCSGTGANLVLANSTDKLSRRGVLSKLQCSDTSVDLKDIRGLVSSLNAGRLIIYTDAAGAVEANELAEELSGEVRVIGETVANTAILSVSTGKSENGFDIAADVRMYGNTDDAVMADVSFYDASDNLIDVRSVALSPGESKTVIVRDAKITGGYVRAELSGLTRDGLIQDNTGYAVIDNTENSDVYLKGPGNRYIDKAVKAATGSDIIKLQDGVEVNGGVVICDREAPSDDNAGHFLIKPEGVSEIEGGYIKVYTSEVTRGLTEFRVGANEVTTYELPAWATEFMSLDDKTVGYYGVHDGVREVVIGFDIRNSEFPLMAEFPIFMANSIMFLGNSSYVDTPYIPAGSPWQISPSVKDEAELKYINEVPSSFTAPGVNSVPEKAGLVSCTTSERTEYIAVRFPSKETDTALTAEGVEFSKDIAEGVSMSSLRRAAIILALLLLIADWFIFIKQTRMKKGLAPIVRIVLLTLLLLAAVGIQLPGRKNKTVTIFVVDMSDSVVELKPQLEDYLKNRLKELPANNEYGILTFGRDSMSEQFVTDSDFFTELGTHPDGTATDIEAAIKNAAAMIPETAVGRIVVLTDGRETLGDVSRTAELIINSDIELDTVILESEEKQDVYIASADMPNTLYPNDNYSLVVHVYASYSVDARISIRKGSFDKAVSDVHLQQGDNTFMFSLTAGEDAIEENDIVVYAEGDQISENDTYSVAANVIAPPRILLLSGLTQDSEGFVELLKNVNDNVNVLSVINAPQTLQDMLAYKTIILDNCFREDIPKGFLENLETYVKDYGGGFIVAGGNESFAPGGYRKTEIEKVLPVDMLPKGIDEAPSMAMVMVIDNSGSMSSEVSHNSMTGAADGRSKLSIALAAATGAVNNLVEDDYVGVLTFDDKYEWRQEIVKIGDNKEDIYTAIQSTPVGGGTVIKPALSEAVDKLKDVDAGIKHLILLTDGEGETTDFQEVIDEINDYGITLSTIAVGSDSAKNLLEELATKCGGRYYYSDSSSEVPRIFAEEVYLSGDTYFQNGDFELLVRSNSNIIKGLFADGCPHISGYVAASAKSNAQTILSSDKDDPILTVWQYGLGKTAAWNTTASGTWNAGFAGNQDYAQLWRNIIDYTISVQSNEDHIEVNRVREGVNVEYSAKDFSEETGISGVYTSPSGKTGMIIFTSDRPGHYVSTFVPDERGIYNINVRRTEAGELRSSQNAVATIQFSDEYKKVKNNNYISFMEQHGKVLTIGDKVFKPIKVKKKAGKDITAALLLISIFLLLFDIIVRRFNMKLPHLKRKTVSGNEETVKTGRKKEQAAPPVMQNEEPAWQEVGASTQMVDPSTQVVEPKGKKKTRPVKQKKSKKSDQEQPAVLDTSALLKKQQDRNNYKS